MDKNIKLGITLLVALCCLFGGYFFFFSSQAQEVLSVDGTDVYTLRHYDSMKYPLYQTKEIKVDSSRDNQEYEAIHLHYPSFLVSIEDFMEYVRQLQQDGFLVITAVNPSLLEGKGCFYELAKPLTGEGYTILVTVNYNYARQIPTISYMKLPGEAEELVIEESGTE